MRTRRTFLRWVIGVAGGVAIDGVPHDGGIDRGVELLAERTRVLRVNATEIVDPILSALESHGRALCRLFRESPRKHRIAIGRMAAETAWIAANAYSDNSEDRRSLYWGKIAARIASDIDDHDLRAHAVARISRTYLSLREPALAVTALNRVDVAKLSPYGLARIEVNRALAVARLDTESHDVRVGQAFGALDAATNALLGASTSRFPRPAWVWWVDDTGFLQSWEAEILRSLTLPSRSVPVFRLAVAVAEDEDNRELPFLQAGLAEVIAQGGDVEEASDEAIRAVVLARAVRADAALGRVRKLYRVLVARAPDSHHVRSLREALSS